MTSPDSEEATWLRCVNTVTTALVCVNCAIMCKLLCVGSGVWTVGWWPSLQQRGTQQDFVTGSGAFSHNINFRSVFPPSGHVTTYQEVWTMVDYILYSSQNETLKLKRRKDLPSSKEMTVLGRIPSVQCPSDHLPLLARFSLKLGQ